MQTELRVLKPEFQRKDKITNYRTGNGDTWTNERTIIIILSLGLLVDWLIDVQLTCYHYRPNFALLQ